jgi:hypothetical protein
MEPPPAVAASLTTWHRAVAAKDLHELSSLLHPDVVLLSPIGFKPLKGAQQVAKILTTVSAVLSHFQYHREFVSGDGHSIALEFSASIGDKQLKGMDVLRFVENGTITELEILVRPFNALEALGAAMAKGMGVSSFRILLARWRSLLPTPR